MKALLYISFLMLFILSSCSSTLYTGAENDDLYYSASDKPVVSDRAAVNNPVAEKELKANSYYDNVYAADTLVTDKYSVPSDYDDQIAANNSNPGSMSGNGYDYYDDSYSNRINMFSGNYYYPYWQDPYYYGYGYGYPYGGLSFGFNFGYGFGFGFGYGYPYYGYGYPYYGYGYPYYGYPYYGYGYYPYYPYYGGGYYPNDTYYSTPYGRRERPSTMSSRWNDNLGTAGSGRRSGSYASSGGRSTTGSQSLTPESRRGVTGVTGGTAVTSQQDNKGDAAVSRSAASTSGSQASTKPEYKSANRSYTPSYNNPRMSTRPSYNNSRISNGSPAGAANSTVGQTRTFGNTATVKNSPRYFNQSSGSGERSSSFSNMQRKYSAPSSGGSSRSYSMPSRRSIESSGGSSRSFSSPSSSGHSSSGSFSRSSSSGSSGGSFSGSSGRSSSGGGGGSHSSGGRR
jgi:hypothetical protein